MADEHGKATDNLGPHLLGRKSHEAEATDWSMEDALASLPPLGPDVAGMTVQEAHDAGYFSSWRAILSFWKWVKAFFPHSPTPAPPPPTPAPPAPPAPPPTPPPAPTPVDTQVWDDPFHGDQGQTGHCVGFGTSGYLAADPVEDPGITDDTAHALYYFIKANIDKEPKAEDGSTVHSAAKALVLQGRIKTYVWASTLDAMKQWVLTQGPIVMGTDWDNDMFNADANGFVKPGGGVAGGHCFVMVGYHDDKDAFEFSNSWGTGWGANGHFFMTTADLQTLWSRAGNEAMAALELPLT